MNTYEVYCKSGESYTVEADDYIRDQHTWRFWNNPVNGAKWATVAEFASDAIECIETNPSSVEESSDETHNVKWWEWPVEIPCWLLLMWLAIAAILLCRIH